MRQSIRIHPEDTVAVALEMLPKGTQTEENGVILTEDIPAGHKFALQAIADGELIRKYGLPIGRATRDIAAGEHVHTHNTRTRLDGEETYIYHSDATELPQQKPAAFDGYIRENGKAGIRNELWILPTVGCVNDIASTLKQKAQALVGGSVEAVCAFEHPYGCSQMGEDQENTRDILADLAVHPNAGGVLVLGLGCENSSVEEIQKHMPPFDTKRIRFLVAQDVDDEIEAGMAILRELSDLMQQDKRQTISADKLIVGLKCGGSDGFSGITANPLLGRFSDRLVAMGGSTILTEVPEMFGAEALLMNRCETVDVFQNTVDMINGFKRYYEEHHQPVYENPSPGNKKGGITTLEDKALGCTQKSGSAVIRDVLPYGGRVQKHGLNLLNAPGNDLVATTALAAAGAQIVLFTTGRGTPFGGPVPTLKISSNTDLAQRKDNWIDFDAGTLLTTHTMEQLTDSFTELVLETASGKLAKNEENNYRGIAIFKTGVTL